MVSLQRSSTTFGFCAFWERKGYCLCLMRKTAEAQRPCIGKALSMITAESAHASTSKESRAVKRWKTPCVSLKIWNTGQARTQKGRPVTVLVFWCRFHTGSLQRRLNRSASSLEEKESTESVCSFSRRMN